MIKQILDDDTSLFTNLVSCHYSRRIISHYDAYGVKYDFCRFFQLKTNDNDIGIISLFNSAMVVSMYEGKKLDSEAIADLAFLARVNKPATIELDAGYSHQLYSYLTDSYEYSERHEFQFVSKNNMPDFDVDEMPKLDDVFAILKTGFPALVDSYDLWLTDTSHRVRRGYSQAFLFNGCTTATVQYIVGNTALIGQVATLPSERGKLYARKLLYWIGERLNLDNISVFLFARNHRKSYYEEIGFKEIGVDYVLDYKGDKNE